MQPTPSRHACHVCAALLTMLLWGIGRSSEAQETPQWRTEAELDRQLQSPVDMTWDQVPLRDGLTRMAQAHRVAIFLDRRVDPDRLIDMMVSGERLELVLHRIAATAELGVSRVGDVMYLGPQETASRLSTVAELQSQFARSSGFPQTADLLDRRAYQWPRLSRPREILAEIVQSKGMTWSNLETVIPHDLWPSADLPPLRTTELLTLVLAGFHASYRFQGSSDGVQLELVPIPDELSLTKTYRFAGSHSEAIAKIRELYPELQVESDGKQIIVSGNQQGHEAVAKLLRGGTARRSTVMPGKKVHSLVVQQQPLEAVLRALEKELGLTIDRPANQTAALNRRVSFTVEKVDLPGLLEAVFRESELTYRLEDDRVIISALE